jgi:hypothetical protein
MLVKYLNSQLIQTALLDYHNNTNIQDNPADYLKMLSTLVDLVNKYSYLDIQFYNQDINVEHLITCLILRTITRQVSDKSFLDKYPEAVQDILYSETNKYLNIIDSLIRGIDRYALHLQSNN